MATIDTLTEVFRQVFADPSIILTPQTTADDVDGWDSLSHVNLIMAVENRFNIRFNIRFSDLPDLFLSFLPPL